MEDSWRTARGAEDVDYSSYVMNNQPFNSILFWAPVEKDLNGDAIHAIESIEYSNKYECIVVTARISQIETALIKYDGDRLYIAVIGMEDCISYNPIPITNPEVIYEAISRLAR